MNGFYSSAPLDRIAVLKGEGAPWHRLAEAYYAGEDEVDRESVERTGKRDHRALQEYRDKACTAAGIGPARMHDMGLALARLEVVAGTKTAADALVPDDFGSLHAAMRVAFRFPEEAKRALRELKSGRITAADLEAMARSVAESQDWPAALDRLAEMKAEGAPWWEMVGPFLYGDEAAQTASLANFRKAGESAAAAYRRRVPECCGLDADEMIRMARTLMRVQVLAGAARVPAHTLLSDDHEAVEIAARLAWSDPEGGIAPLADLAAGRIDKDGLAARLTAVAASKGP